MNACPECAPTHNRDVRERGRCWCPCHSPAESRREAVDLSVFIEFALPEEDAEAVDLLRRLADRLERRGLPEPCDDVPILDVNGNTVGTLTVEVSP